MTLIKPNFSFLVNFSIEEFQNDSSEMVYKLFDVIKIYLGLDPFYEKLDFRISENFKNSENKNIFNIGVNRKIQNQIVIIEINERYLEFLPFIILREIYNLFIPFEILDYEPVQMVINQILMTDLSKNKYLKEWRTLIRENLEQYKSQSLRFNRLREFDRLDQFFKLQEKKKSKTPTQFFFKYIRENLSLIHEKIGSFHDIFFDEYEKYFLKLMVDDDLIETIRCILEIFYDVKQYRDILTYKKLFQEFKENKKLKTELSLRKFSEYMDWIKTETFIAPNYQLNFNSINICFITIILEFNPLLSKRKIYEFLENFPFLLTPKISQTSFSLELIGYIIIPKVYLEDFLKFVEKLKNKGYIIKYDCLLVKNISIFTNLNYFRRYSQGQQLLDNTNQKYEKKYELECNVNFGEEFYAKELSLLEFLVIDRIRFFSTSGFGFERRSEALMTLRSDLINIVLTQRAIIKNLRDTLKIISRSNELKQELKLFIKKNRKFGFFYIKSHLAEFLILAKIIGEFLSDNQHIKNISQLNNIIQTKYISLSIKDNIIFRNQQFRKTVFNKLLPLYFQSRNKYKTEINKYKTFSDLFNSFYSLNMFNLESVERIIDEVDLIETIYKDKENKYISIYEKFKPYKITIQEVDGILDKFVNSIPPIIQPKMVNTLPITLYSQDFIYELILIDSQENYLELRNFKKIFPNILITHTKSLLSDLGYLFVEIYTPKLTIEERFEFNSLIYNNFKDNIHFGKRFLWSGYIEALTSRKFYDFERKEFQYTGDLFDQIFRDVQKNFGSTIDIIEEKKYLYKDLNWSKEETPLNLVKSVNSRVLHENYDFNINSINTLLEFHSNLNKYLKKIEKFKKVKQEYFFRNYIKSIKFIPALHLFGFSKCFFYLYSTDMNEVDIKLLLLNTFTRVRYPAAIDNSNSFFIESVIPYRKPNLAYLNWLAKAKKVVREYCVFFIKKIYLLFHFNYNLGPDGWKLDKDRFKIYMQNILFNSDYNIEIPKLKEFNVELKSSTFFGPDTPEFKALTQIYNWEAIDIKSYLGTRNYTTINHIKNLMRRNLIFPYLSLKNLDLNDQIIIILPNIRFEINKTLLKIFSFFNYGFIYEIEGEFFIYGFPEDIKFENGLMLELYLPKCELHEFMRIFDSLFEYLEIKDYLILNDLVDGSQLLKSIYGGLDFLKDYNPLKNLKWNPKDKQWMNHKLYTQKFEPIYPELTPNEKE